MIETLVAVGKMREMNPNFPNPLPVKIEEDSVFSGLEDFLKGLERLFFAEATAKIWMSESGSRDLVLHVSSPIHLPEALRRHRRGHWGRVPEGGMEYGVTGLEEMLQTIEKCNGRPVDIEELSLELDGTLIVVRKSGFRSIAREFDFLMETLAAHLVYLTRGMLEMPYEIYIPVVEEVFPEASPPASNVSELYGFWGVYFESEPDARIYDVREQQILDCTSFLLDGPTAR